MILATIFGGFAAYDFAHDHSLWRGTVFVVLAVGCFIEWLIGEIKK